MKCIYCGFADTKVADKRTSEQGDISRRRRECLKCGKRFTTYEKADKAEIFVIKKDGGKKEFDREKLEKSIKSACGKRPVSETQITDILDDIEMRLINRNTNIVSTSELGRLVLTRIKKLDLVAYMRFASVFLDFEDLEDFQQEISKLK